VGSALLAVLEARARDRGAIGLTGEVWDDDPGSFVWVERRGFVEVERQLALELDLAAHEPVTPAPPAGVRIVTRAELGDAAPLEAMWRVSLEADADIPGLDSEEPTSFEQWRARNERPSSDPRFSFVALAGDEVVGIAALDVFPHAAYHGLTGVVRAWRGRGVAEALKRSQIAAAKASGIPRLYTESQHGNMPMRRLNEKLGFVPAPGTIVVRGPLARRG
jgi:GNAT superfamily N-acetyltransferase